MKTRLFYEQAGIVEDSHLLRRPHSKVNADADDVREGCHHVRTSTSRCADSSATPRASAPVAVSLQRRVLADKYFSVASGGGTSHYAPDNMLPAPPPGMTDTIDTALQRVRWLQLRCYARRHDGPHRHEQQRSLHRCVRRRRRVPRSEARASALPGFSDRHRWVAVAPSGEGYSGGGPRAAAWPEAARLIVSLSQKK